MGRHDFTEVESSEFMAKCKANGVTVHTGFFTVTMVAMLELLRGAGLVTPDMSVDMGSGHSINGRRFIDTRGRDMNTMFGCAINLMTTRFTVEKNARENIWKTAQEYHKVFKDGLENEQPICEVLRMIEMSANAMKDGKIPPRRDTSTKYF